MPKVLMVVSSNGIYILYKINFCVFYFSKYQSCNLYYLAIQRLNYYYRKTRDYRSTH